MQEIHQDSARVAHIFLYFLYNYPLRVNFNDGDCLS